MASDSNIKKVTLEIGGKILRTQEWTDIDGYFETTEVGLGTFTADYKIAKCLSETEVGWWYMFDGIPDWVYDEDNENYPTVKDALEASRCGDQRNTAPYFNLPHFEGKGFPNYVGFKIVDVETIGQSQVNELTEFNYVNDADGDLSSLELNTNSYAINSDMSDMRTYTTGNPLYDWTDPQWSTRKTWEFKPGGFTPLIGQTVLGVEYGQLAWPGGGKTIWKFVCEKPGGQAANFRSPGARGPFWAELDSDGTIND